MFNWYNRQHHYSFSKAISVSASSATVLEILGCCMLFFRFLKIRMLNWNKSSFTVSTLIQTLDC